MSEPAKFLFERDFGRPKDAPSPKLQAALEDAEARGYAAGHADGRAQALAEADAALEAALARVADAAERLLAEAEERGARLEEEALAFAQALAVKLAGDAVARFPMDAIAEVARTAFAHLAGVPHLVVRVNEGLVEKTERLVQRIARERGFEGRLVILGDPEIAPGDARFEWADGGVLRDGAALGREIAAAITGT